MNHHTPKNSATGTIHDNRSRSEGALDRAGELDVVLRQLAGDVGIDAGGDEIGAALVVGLLELALDVVAADPHLGDVAGLQIVLELAVGDLRDLRVGGKDRLDDQHGAPTAATQYQVWYFVSFFIGIVGVSARDRPRRAARIAPR